MTAPSKRRKKVATLRGGSSGESRRSPSPKNFNEDELTERDSLATVLSVVPVSVCTFCGEPFAADDVTVDLQAMQMHEDCLPLMLASSHASSSQDRCLFCNERKGVGGERSCNACNRRLKEDEIIVLDSFFCLLSICEHCKKESDRCAVCCWKNAGYSAESRAVSSLVAVQAHAARSKNDLPFEKGDDLELLGKTEFGYNIGRTIEPVMIGLFPPSAAAVVKKYSLRGIRKTCMKKEESVFFFLTNIISDSSKEWPIGRWKQWLLALYFSHYSISD